MWKRKEEREWRTNERGMKVRGKGKREGRREEGKGVERAREREWG